MRVVVGMSGGVDSSVTALLLKEAGYDVIGLFMKNWEEEEGPCPSAKDHADVVAVAAKLGIPHYTVNFAKEYWERVFAVCLEQYAAGHTPNPDILCNREIKFQLFFKKAMEIGADYLATGHYARRLTIDGKSHLARGLDCDKDQSYFLYTMQQSVLDRVLFPVGELRKKEVRALAEKYGLATAHKKDSTGICFIGKRNFREFLSRYIKPAQGEIMTLSGRVVGEHQGVAYYTLGQRKGLAIGGAGDAWFVVRKDRERNILFVEQGEDHPALYHKALVAHTVSWVGKAPMLPIRLHAKIRYRSSDVPCTVHTHSEGLYVEFESPQKAITPYQSIVFYDGPLCLGGALIKCPC